jgi:hypothetical protein
MKKFYILTILAAIVVMVISSCSTTNKVTSDNLIQKRKYRSGYYVQSPFNHLKKGKTEVTETLNKPDELPSESEFVSSNENKNNVIIIASVNDDPKSIIQTNSVLDNMKGLYNSDFKDISTFKNEYHKTKKELGTTLSLNSPKKKEMSERNLLLKHVGGGFSIASFVLGIIGFITQGYVCGVLAIVFGIIGLVRGRRKGLAVFGLIFGILDIIGASLALTLIIP